MPPDDDRSVDLSCLALPPSRALAAAVDEAMDSALDEVVSVGEEAPFGRVQDAWQAVQPLIAALYCDRALEDLSDERLRARLRELRRGRADRARW